jgi:hypothetical protein
MVVSYSPVSGQDSSQLEPPELQHAFVPELKHLKDGFPAVL